MRIRFLLACAPVLLLAACAAVQPSGPPPPSTQQIVDAIHAAGRNDHSALRVTPLRDPGVQELIDKAHGDAAAGDYTQAAAVLDRALQQEPNAPDLLQDRAEIAVRLHHYDHAEQLAQSSWSSGPRLGSLCARNWQTVLEMRKLANDTQGEATARKKRDACTVKGVVRM